ncbi:MAG: 1-deoxy-D-xylulose-5-phosphate synthase, partial [Tumebacillaceae bacterium]
HFGSNLGVVELTLALHQVYNSPVDKIIWDVGHQAYVHKILTGRKHLFPTLRKFKGMAGFPKRTESEHDMFGVGHSSTSISAALGYAAARDIEGAKHKVVAVIGDGAMTGGMAFEALNHAGDLNSDMVVVLNDNEMSIAPNVGAVHKYLTKLRSDPTYSSFKKEVASFLHKVGGDMGDKATRVMERFKDSVKYFMVPGALFEQFGFTYMGPINGHDLPTLLEYLKQAKNTKGPVHLHVVTQKGKGYAVAADAPDKMHSVSKGFNVKPGEAPKVVKPAAPQYNKVFGDTMIKLATQDPDVIAITPAMPEGAGLTKYAATFPKRFFDVGIAEQHAGTFAAALACGGKKPVLAIYSTFLQRAYDQVIHDICIQKLPVTITIDRAGLVGADGETHQGAFDVSFLRCIPNLTIMMPKDENEMQHMLYTATNEPGPVAVRYPRGEGRGVQMDEEFKLIPIGKSETVREGGDIAILALGTMVEVAERAADVLAADGIEARVVNMRFVKPLDEELLLELAKKGTRIVTLEEAAVAGGMGSAILEFYASNRITGVELVPLGLPDRFVEHGSPQELLDSLGLNVQALVDHVKTMVPLKQKRA